VVALTSKEVLERTGISRATLNNYIGTGLIPRPEVLPPGAEHGSAPRIGYFPAGTVERIAEIQRLKAQGWSIARIAQHFAGGGAAPAATPTAARSASAPVHPIPAPPAPLAADAAAASTGISPLPRFETAGADAAAAPVRRFPAPRLTEVAVLVSTLQDAGELWLQLPAGEYFELVNEVWLALDRIFARHGGRHGRHPGEGMVCHFLPHPDGSYLWSALTAAQQTRDAMREISNRWQARKDWDFELRMNTGVDEGQEWLGPLRLAEPLELTVVGGAADHAAQLSRAARAGAVWITRNLVGKLSAEERSRLTFGVPRPARGAAGRRVLSSFARLQDLAAMQVNPVAVPPTMADLAVTELLEIATPPAPSTSLPGQNLA
jgi:class 3 adenylate cyclase